jgi:diadenosine tetraphosphate (Ap4A) HIT family hydrolase
MSEADCVFCRVVAALERSDTCPAGEAGQVLRKVRDLPASIAILAPDQYYKGYTMVVSKTHAIELYELPERQSTQYFQDMVAVARAIATAFKPRKMNYEVLGNTVGHLHWHLFPRYEWDPNPKRPTWETNHPPSLPSPDEYADIVATLCRHLS